MLFIVSPARDIGAWARAGIQVISASNNRDRFRTSIVTIEASQSSMRPPTNPYFCRSLTDVHGDGRGGEEIHPRLGKGGDVRVVAEIDQILLAGCVGRKGNC